MKQMFDIIHDVFKCHTPIEANYTMKEHEKGQNKFYSSHTTKITKNKIEELNSIDLTNRLIC